MFHVHPTYRTIVLKDEQVIATASHPVWAKKITELLNAQTVKQYRFNHMHGNDGDGHRNAICVQAGPKRGGFVPIRFLHDGREGLAHPSELTEA